MTIDMIPRWASADSEPDFTTPVDFGDAVNPTAFRDAVAVEFSSKQLGENGCAEYTDSGVGSNVLALSQLVRGGDPSALAEEILSSGSPSNISDLVVLMFATRNARGGKG